MLLKRYMSYGFLFSVLLLQSATTTAEPLTNITFVAFDVETTGLSRKDRVIEIAAVKFRGTTEIAAASWLINPGIPIPKSAQRVHGITDSMVKGSPAFAEVFTNFLVFADDSILLAHNASYDARMINQEVARLDLTAPTNAVADTLRLSRIWFPEIESHSLKSVLTHLEMTQKEGHRALSDTRDVMRLFIAGTEKMGADTRLKEIEKAISSPFRRSPESKPE